jgi:hypothetical protein
LHGLAGSGARAGPPDTGVRPGDGGVRRGLDIHARLEEEIFYPAAEDVEGLAEVVQQGRRDHRRIRHLLGEICAPDPGHRALGARVRALRTAVLRHAAQARQLLPKAEHALGGDALARLGFELRARKRQLARRRGRASRGAAWRAAAA